MATGAATATGANAGLTSEILEARKATESREDDELEDGESEDEESEDDDESPDEFSVSDDPS